MARPKNSFKGRIMKRALGTAVIQASALVCFLSLYFVLQLGDDYLCPVSSEPARRS